LTIAEGDRRADDLSDYTELVLAVADEFEVQAESRGIELGLDVSGVGVHALPRTRTMTILRHVVQNAIDAMPRGGRLTIQGSIQGPMIVTRVSDTGKGLEPEELSRVFEPFWSTKPSQPGEVSRTPGLGLAIVHGIVQMMGGTISATSRPGEGTCFTIRLPKSTLE
jgi:two-component system NtrC family sensor kinase